MEIAQQSISEIYGSCLFVRPSTSLMQNDPTFWSGPKSSSVHISCDWLEWQLYWWNRPPQCHTRRRLLPKLKILFSRISNFKNLSFLSLLKSDWMSSILNLAKNLEYEINKDFTLVSVAERYNQKSVPIFRIYHSHCNLMLWASHRLTA